MYCAHCGNEVQTLAADCPSCGKPASGAPASSGKSSSAIVVTLIVVFGGLFLVAIIGIIAAIAIPNFINAVERGKQKRTVADLRAAGTALQAHYIDYGFYPEADNLDALAEQLEPTYIKLLPLNDGWEFPIKYQCWQVDPEAKGCDNFAIASPGKDGVLDFVDLRKISDEGAPTTYFDCDIVYRNGVFIQWPEGTQRR